MSGGSQGSTNTIQNANPWVGQQPYLSEGFSAANTLYGKGGPQMYPGQISTPFVPAQTTAPQQLINYAQGPGQTLANEATAGNTFLTNPNILNPATNPSLQAYGQAAIQPMQQQFLEKILPALRSNASMAGQVGGSREGIGEGVAAGELATQEGNTLAQIYSNAYGQGLKAMESGVGFAPSTLAAGATPSTQLSAAGGTQQAMQDVPLQEAISRWNYQQQLPWANLNNFLSLIAGQYGGTSFGSTQSSPGSPGALGVLGTGAMGAAALYPWLKGISFGGGAGAGAGASGLGAGITGSMAPEWMAGGGAAVTEGIAPWLVSGAATAAPTIGEFAAAAAPAIAFA